MDRNQRLNQIINELNEIAHELDNLEGWGAIDLDIALDYRADSWDGDYEDYQEPTIEEVDQIKAECERNALKVENLENKKNNLIEEYWVMTGTSPHYYDLTNTYARSWHEKKQIEDEE